MLTQQSLGNRALLQILARKMGRDGGCDQGNNECTGKTDGKKIQFPFVHDRLTRIDVSGDQTIPLFGFNKT